MKRTLITCLLAGAVFGRFALAQTSSPTPSNSQWRLERSLTDSEGCIFIADPGNMYETRWGNSCASPIQFTIHWSGNHAERDVTYRTNGRSSIRVVTRRDVNGTLIKEGAATMGLGSPSDAVRLEKQPLELGQTLLSVVNDDEHPAFAGGYISIRKNGKEVRKCELGILVVGAGHAEACAYFSGEDFVSFMEAERDPN